MQKLDTATLRTADVEARLAAANRSLAMHEAGEDRLFALGDVPVEEEEEDDEEDADNIQLAFAGPGLMRTPPRAASTPKAARSSAGRSVVDYGSLAGQLNRGGLRGAASSRGPDLEHDRQSEGKQTAKTQEKRAAAEDTVESYIEKIPIHAVLDGQKLGAPIRFATKFLEKMSKDDEGHYVLFEHLGNVKIALKVHNALMSPT